MPVVCSICEKAFSTQYNHNRHVKEVHKEVPKPVSYGKDSIWSSRCLEPNCDSAFKTNKNLMEHLQNIHSIKFEIESHHFEDMNAFDNWKSEIESANNCCYVLKSKNASTTAEVIYYKCNRSKIAYNIKEMEQRSRLLKSQGSCKLSYSCTSEIKIIIENSKILVEWQKVHYGHNIQLQHIRLPKIEKQNIVIKLVNGVTSQRILETTRDQIGEHLNRIDLLTSRDLRNIKNSNGLEIKHGKRDPNDAFSPDKGLNAVLKYERDKSIERIIRLSKGEHTRPTSVLSRSHKEALKDSGKYIIVDNNTNWEISKNGHTLYTIHQLLGTKCCERICFFCKACIHMFSCECKFYKERKLMCKHIHIILAWLDVKERSKNTDSTVEEVHISEELSALPAPQLLNKKIKNIKAMAAKFESLDFKELNDEEISKIHYHLTIATNLTDLPGISGVNNEFKIKNKPSKRLIDPQTRFTSTKKKRVEARTSLKRASAQEAKNIEENLTHTPEDSFIYKSVLALNDHQYC